MGDEPVTVPIGAQQFQSPICILGTQFALHGQCQIVGALGLSVGEHQVPMGLLVHMADPMGIRGGVIAEIFWNLSEKK